MTDIDAIRKTKRYERYFDGMREERKGRYVTAIALDAALLAYDAKCEELATEREAHAATLINGAEKIADVCAERDAAVRDANGWLRRYGSHDSDCAGAIADCTCGYRKALQHMTAALAPPTEQPTEQQKVMP